MKKPDKKDGIETVYVQGYNQCKEEYDQWILEQLDELKFHPFQLKTSELFNGRIDTLIQRIKSDQPFWRMGDESFNRL